MKKSIAKLLFGIMFLLMGICLIANAQELEFQSGAQFLPPHSLNSGHSRSADFNNDGRMDIIFAETLPTNIRIWIQQEDGSFTDETENRMPELYYGTWPLVILDVESDGDMDIFGGSWDNNLPVGRILINDGDGYFTDETSTRLPAEPVRCKSAKAAPIDENSSPDIVILEDEVGPKLLLNDGNGFFTWDTQGRMPVRSILYWELQVVDIDGDHLNDILFATMNGDGVICYYNTGDGFYENQTNIRIPEFDIDFIEDLIIGDVDNDGDIDFVGVKTDAYGASLPLYINDGDGYFDWPDYQFPIPVTHWPFKGEFAFFDDDEYLDLFITNTDPEESIDLLFINNGDGTFTDNSNLLPSRPERTTHCVVFDHRNDGDMDIFVIISDWVFDYPKTNFLYENLLDPNSDIEDKLFSDSPPNSFDVRNYPNPFNPNTTITFTIPQDGVQLQGGLHLMLNIYDASGMFIKTLFDKPMEAGYHSVLWDGKDEAGKNMSSGLYICRIESKHYNLSRPMILLK